jgi:rSAM/selenodomain-associated transferase 2
VAGQDTLETETCAVSVIIPVFNDTQALSALLRQLAMQRPRPLEVIVVDGAEQANSLRGDDVAQLCRDSNVRHLPSVPGRGRQLRAGAAAARGEVLWFLHADAILPAAALRALLYAVAFGARGGYFRFQFSGPRNLSKRVVEFFVRWRCRVATVYGDQGIFAKHDVYNRTPGFAATPLFEEVPLVKALRQEGGFVALDAAIEVDCRRWEQRGFWRQTFRNRLLACGYAIGVSPERLARWYR